MRFFIGVFAAMVFVSAPVAAQPTPARGLAEAYDELRLILDSTAPEKERLLAATRKACNEMTRLLNDPAFSAQLTRAFTKEGARAGSELRSDLRRFLEEFLPLEQRVLEQNGVPPATAARLLATIATFRNVKEVADPKAVLDVFRSVRDQLCSAAAEIEKGSTPVDKGRILTWTVRIGGAVAVVADAMTATPSAGLALASISIGTAVMSWGF